VIEADDPDDAVAIAGMLTTCPLPKGRRVAVVTVSGGGGAWMADTLTANGLSLPLLSSHLQAGLRPLMPSYGAAQNPVDVTAQGAQTGPAMMSAAECLAASDEIDMLVMITSLASEHRVSLDSVRLRGIIEQYRKPLAVWTYTPPSDLGRTRLAESGLFLHVDLRGCGLAMGRLAQYAEALSRQLPSPPTASAMLPLPADLPRVLTEHRVKTLLAPFGVPMSEERLATSAADAEAAASAIGFPVALKVQSPDLPHKTEAGGVRLGLADRATVVDAYGTIIAAARRYCPDAQIEGVLVQKMAPPGHELVVGMVNDPTFGPVMMVGWGGTMVELMGDVAHRLAPVDVNEAHEMIASLRSARLLEGFRGALPIDIAPVAELVARLSAAAMAHRDRIAEMEFNPVILHADGSGLTIADALVTLRD
jgi:acyl-CoA synthetase (NDP forming)